MTACHPCSPSPPEEVGPPATLVVTLITAASPSTGAPSAAPTCRPAAGADFPATGPDLPKIRQLPQQCSAALDDKRRMWECLAAAGEAGVTPHTIADLEAFLQQHSQPGGAVADGGAPEASFLVARGFEEPLPPSQQQGRQPPPAGQHGWFLKHRRGVKGQAVHYLPTTAALLERLQGLSAHSRRALVAQAAVPPLLLRGRKFVLRAHVLLRLLAAAGGESSRLAAYVHEVRTRLRLLSSATLGASRVSGV